VTEHTVVDNDEVIRLTEALLKELVMIEHILLAVDL
jgi:hypothetical protein